MSNIEIIKKHALTGHQNPIFALERNVDSTLLFTAGNDKGVVEWDLIKGEFKRVLLPVKSSVYCLHRIANSSLLAVGERSGLVTIVDFEANKVVAKLIHHEKPVFGIQSFYSKPELIVSSEDGTVSIWNTQSFQRLYNFSVSKDTVRCIALNKKENVFALGSKDSKVRVFDANEYSLIHEIDEHSAAITALCFSPDTDQLLTGGRDAQLNIFDPLDYHLVKNLTAHMFTVYGIVYNPELPILATASRDKSIKIWRAEDFSLLKNISLEKGYPVHRLSINNILWSSRTTLITVSDDKIVMVWEINIT